MGFSSPSINNQLFSGIVNMIGILAFFWQYIYSHLDAVYLKWNKIVQKFCNPSFSIIQTVNVRFKDDNMSSNFLESLIKNLSTKLSRELDSPAKISSKPNNEKATIVLDENGIATITLSLYSTDEDDEYQLYIEYKNSIQYNDRIKELSIIQSIFAMSTSELHVMNNKMQVRLFFEDRNPFYGYMLKRNKGIKVSNFYLDFEINNKVDAHVEKHYMEINSEDYTEFANIFEDIIILANTKKS